MCSKVLRDPRFFQALFLVDAELAEETRSVGCSCGGRLHRADYERKPRGALISLKPAFSRRFSFCSIALVRSRRCRSESL